MAIELINLEHTFSEGTPFEHKALDKISLTIDTGNFIGLIGHTGSGKSTLIQHINGLIKPTGGTVVVDDLDLSHKDTKMAQIRRRVGLVFQYPEYQLFEETIEKDIAFGPTNLGFDKEEVSKRVVEAMESVGLDYNEYKDKSPFDLSGGQMRRVAIAGVIAMKPDVLILDEPTAGLDPRGRDEILEEIQTMHDKFKMTVILVSHSMEDIAKYADKIIVMYKGKVEFYDSPSSIFKESERLIEIGLAVPQVTELMKKLKAVDPLVDEGIFTVEAAKEEIMNMIRRRNNV
ncbi:energy-coupling factor transport system ATP-binding protein [Alkalibaculum bacchi]|uniref:Energy-coupling factor transporter ATP-binding protein EcfA2 n=1 Tax=Alkalibaculum bacchi TaxID=645887 RepID=A0A366IDW5_9FIRM|nr:energy-coupling factor transporter ATPase [Alkalibaculum bacchi]RBP67432.1 energy-coupling factor transport system ATP-binding protein [Alkalibaculum bacchi]